MTPFDEGFDKRRERIESTPINENNWTARLGKRDGQRFVYRYPSEHFIGDFDSLVSSLGITFDRDGELALRQREDRIARGDDPILTKIEGQSHFNYDTPVSGRILIGPEFFRDEPDTVLEHELQHRGAQVLGELGGEQLPYLMQKMYPPPEGVKDPEYSATYGDFDWRRAQGPAFQALVAQQNRAKELYAKRYGRELAEPPALLARPASHPASWDTVGNAVAGGGRPMENEELVRMFMRAVAAATGG